MTKLNHENFILALTSANVISKVILNYGKTAALIKTLPG